MLRAALRLSIPLVAKKSEMNAPKVRTLKRVRPMTAITSGASPSATGAGTISNSHLMPCFARSSPPNTPAKAPRKMLNGNSDSTNEKATAPAMPKPLSA